MCKKSIEQSSESVILRKRGSEFFLFLSHLAIYGIKNEVTVCLVIERSGESHWEIGVISFGHAE